MTGEAATLASARKLLRDPILRQVFLSVTVQSEQRGWAHLLVSSWGDLIHLESLTSAGLVSVLERDVRLNEVAQVKSGEIICALTELGQVVANAMPKEDR